MAPSITLGLERLLMEAMGLGAHDVLLEAGRPASFHGPRGSSTKGEPIDLETLRATAARLATSVDEASSAVLGIQIEGVGRIRVSASKGCLALRVLGKSPFLAPGLDGLSSVKQGLVIIGGPPGSGRSTSFSALLHEAFDLGRVIASLEEPVSFPRCSLQWNAEPGRAEGLVKAMRAAKASVAGFDLIDDAAAAELALQAAAEDRLAVCTMLGLSIGAILERLAAIDAPYSRSRIAEQLRAVACLTPGHAANLLWPTEALRAHLIRESTPPPPELLGST